MVPDFLVLDAAQLTDRQVTGLAVNAADPDSAIRQVAKTPGVYLAVPLGDATHRVVTVDRRMTLRKPTP